MLYMIIDVMSSVIIL